MAKKKKSKIEYGNVNIPAEDFAPENTYIRISLMIREDILKYYKKEAEKHKLSYTDLIENNLNLRGLIDMKLDEIKNKS